MKQLNLRTPKSYDRSLEAETENARAYFYLVTEGATEESYFEGINNNKRLLNIKNNIFVEVVPKEEGAESYSHPYQLVLAALRLMGRMDENGNEIPENEWAANCKLDYDKNTDVICVIFDRDYKNLEIHLDSIYELCIKNNIYIGLSNPNFELWLLMHFADIDEYDRDLLYRNPKNIRNQYFEDASVNKKYLEILVSRSANGYKKGGSLKFERFIDGISLAMEQEKLFEEDVEQLKENLGSNIGKLVAKIKS